MSTVVPSVWRQVYSKLRSLPLLNILVVASYLFFVVFYMGPSIWNCSDTLSGLGDSTGGPVWRAGLEPKQPLLGGPEKFTNFPSGENLYSPVGVVSVEQTLMMSGLSKLVGPVCAYNTINVLGYMSTALVMFFFVLYLLRNRWIAWFAGYAVAFTPYAQSKVGGHPSYGYASLLLAVFWLTLHIIKRKRWVHGVGLGVALAVCSYFDPYFILLAGTVLVPTLLVWMVQAILAYRRGGKQREGAIQTLKVFLVALASFSVLIAPLVIIRIKDAAVINSSTGAVRGNIEDAAMKCSNFPHDYLLPDPYNNSLVRLLGPGYTAKNISARHWCGAGESRVSISLVIIGLSTVGAIVLLWERVNARRLRLSKLLNYNATLAIGAVLLVAVAALLLGLPPRIGGYLMPSGVVIMLTKTWRIFAREYLVLNMMLVILSAIMLSYFYQSFKGRFKKTLIFLFIGLSAVVMFEYQIHDAFIPFTFSYKRDVPKIYHQIRDNPDITALAEYPIDRTGIEADSIVYYLTMQTVHRKNILNSAATTNVNEKLHVAIKDITDPQTIPILRSLGIRYITIHGLTAKQVQAKTDQLEIVAEETPPVYGLTMLRAAPTNTFVLAKIIDGPSVDYAVTINKGYAVNLEIMKSSVDLEYETIPNSELSVTSLYGRKPAESNNVCFDLKMAAIGDASDVIVSVNGKPQQTVAITDKYSTVRLDAKSGDTIKINNLKQHNTRINNLGCRP